MARFTQNLNNFISGLSAAYAGHVAGSLAGHQQAMVEAEQERQKKAQEQQQALQLFEAYHNLYGQQQAEADKPYELLGTHMKDLAPPGQAAALGEILKHYGSRAPNPYGTSALPGFLQTGTLPNPATTPNAAPPPSTGVGGKGFVSQASATGAAPAAAPEPAPVTSIVQKTPLVLSPEQETPSPMVYAPGYTPPAPVTQKPAPGAFVMSPGGQRLEMAGGIDKERVQAQNEWKALTGKLPNLNLTPEQAQQIQQYVTGTNTNPQTPDELQTFRTRTAALNSMLVGLGTTQGRLSAANYKEDKQALSDDLDQVSRTPGSALVPTLLNLWQRHQDLQTNYKGRPSDVRLLGSEEDLRRLADTQAQIQQEQDPAKKAALQQTASGIAERVQGRMASGLSGPEIDKKIQRAIQILGQMSPERRATEGPKLFENLGVGFALRGITPDFGGGKLEEEWSKLFGEIPKFGALPVAARAALVQRLGALSSLLHRPFSLKASDIQKADPKTQLEISKLRGEINMQGTRAEILKAQLAIDKTRQESEKYKLAQLKAGKGGAAQKGDLTENKAAEQFSHTVDTSWRAYQDFLKENPRTTDQIDNPDPGDPFAVELKKRRDAWEAATEARNRFFYNRGWDISTGKPVPRGSEMPAKPQAPAYQAPKGGGAGNIPAANRGAAAERAAGTANSAAAEQRWSFTFGGRQYRNVTKRSFYDGLAAAGANEAERNAIMRSVFKGQ